MAKKLTLLLLVLAVITVLCATLGACGETASTTTEATTTQVQTEDTTTEVTTTITTAKVTTEPQPVVTYPPVESEIYAMIDSGEVEHVEPHMTYSIGTRVCADNVERDWVWYFTIKAEGLEFFNTTEDHPTHPNTPGLQLTTGKWLYIKKVATNGDDSTADADYTKYDITYWETAQWYEIWCTVDGFVPEDGAAYDIFLFFESGDDGATWPNTLHYVWNFGTEWVYEAPPTIDSSYLTEDQIAQLTAGKLWLYQHEVTTIDANGLLTYSFKSDNQPFTDPENATEGGIYGVSFTLFDELYINGEKIDNVENYGTVDWYKITFTIPGYTFESGEKYEILFTIQANDPSGTYCNNPGGYYAYIEYTQP